jgi:iron(III) transport system substrate-binding protein
MRDTKNPPTWVGMDIWAAALCVNTIEAGQRRRPTPTGGAALTRPKDQRQRARPHPASSGTDYLMVSAWLQSMGAEVGWKYRDARHPTMARSTPAGSKPCRQAAAREYAAGLSFESRAHKTKKEGALRDIVLPKEGWGWAQEATAILRTSKKLDATKRLAGAVTPRANALYAENLAVVALPGIAKPLEFIPTDIEQRLLKNDFAWAAEHRERILAEWSRRYDGKSEPQK